MTYVMLVGTDVALLEGIAQSLARQGHRPVVATSLVEARELALTESPLVLVAERTMASSAGADLLSVAICPGGARVLYRRSSVESVPLVPALQRAVLAELTLPLERHRLSALVHSVGDRAKTTGRAQPSAPSEKSVDS